VPDKPVIGRGGNYPPVVGRGGENPQPVIGRGGDNPPPRFGRPVPPAPVIGLGGTPPLSVNNWGRPPVAPRFVRAPGQRPAAFAAALLNNKRHRARELLVEVSNNSPDALKQALASEYGVRVQELGVFELINARLWLLTLNPGQDLGTALRRLLQDNRVIRAQPNYIYTPVQGEGKQSSLGSGDAVPPKTASEITPAAGGVKVAVIDTCVDREHPELQGSVRTFFDATLQGGDSCEAENHGTAVASLIGGHDSIRGADALASIFSVRAFKVTEEERQTAATSREIAIALNWAAIQHARVANLSFTGPSDPLIESEVVAAHATGIVLVGAAGNAGPSSPPLYPAAYPEVIAVTATDAKHGLYSAANRGPYIAVSARGVDVIVAHVRNTYGTESGTSFAAATVSGIVAHLLETSPNATPDDIRAALQNTAVRVAGTGRSDLFGYGFVNVKGAETFLGSAVSPERSVQAR
jgi:subtilisin family serine protease